MHRLHRLVRGLFYRLGYSLKPINPRVRGAGVAGKGGEPGIRKLMQLLHRENPYKGFDYRAYPHDEAGWNSPSPLFQELVEETGSSLVIEVGTWKGASALHCAELLRRAGRAGGVLCIDTWLGCVGFWADTQDATRHGALQLRHGYPTVYYQFLANVCHRGLQDWIVPFPQTSSIAALWLRTHGVRSRLIYLDASHEEEDVHQDLWNYWNLVESGGVLFGDDYQWSGVALAVDRFARETGQKPSLHGSQWVFRRR